MWGREASPFPSEESELKMASKAERKLYTCREKVYDPREKMWTFQSARVQRVDGGGVPYYHVMVRTEWNPEQYQHNWITVEVSDFFSSAIGLAKRLARAMNPRGIFPWKENFTFVRK